jgi:hypothetical protein
MFILHILGCLLKERHNLQKKMQLWVMQIIHGNGGKKGGPPNSIISLFWIHKPYQKKLMKHNKGLLNI